MFGKRGRSWIALFDPVGPRDEWPELIERFIRLSRAHGGRAAFYQVRPDSLPIYLDAGFSVMKLGEDAVIPLSDFTLKGGAASHLRYALKRGERDGLEFELAAAGAAGPHLNDLADISASGSKRGEARRRGSPSRPSSPTISLASMSPCFANTGELVAFVSVMLREPAARRRSA